jgi:hypothetical protein
MAILGMIVMSMPLGVAIGLFFVALLHARFDVTACRDQPDASE